MLTMMNDNAIKGVGPNGLLDYPSSSDELLHRTVSLRLTIVNGVLCGVLLRRTLILPLAILYLSLAIASLPFNKAKWISIAIASRHCVVTAIDLRTQ